MMAFEVLGAINASTPKTILQLGYDSCSRRLGSLEVTVNIVNINLETNVHPTATWGTVKLVTPRGRKVDEDVADFHERSAPPGPGEARLGSLTKAEYPLQPVNRFHDVLISKGSTR